MADLQKVHDDVLIIKERALNMSLIVQAHEKRITWLEKWFYRVSGGVAVLIILGKMFSDIVSIFKLLTVR